MASSSSDAQDTNGDQHKSILLRRIGVVANHLSTDKNKKVELNKSSVQNATDLEKSASTLPEEILKDLQKANKTELKYNRAGEPYFPMTAAQISVFLHQSQIPESRKLNSGSIMDMVWGIDYNLLERCFNEAVQDHITMHSTYTTHVENGVAGFWVTVKACPKLQLQIHRKNTFTLDPFVALPERHVILMDSGLVVRGDVYELDHPIIIITCHQIAMDGVALTQFTNEVFRRYSGKLSLHPAIQQSYVKICASVSYWQDQALVPRLETLREYWLSHLLATDKVHLPFLITPTQTSKPIGREVKFDLKAHSKALGLACKEIGLRSVSMLLSLWIFLISYYTNQEGVVVNTTFHGRTRPIFARILSSFAISLPVSVVVPPGSTQLSEFAQQMNATLTQHYFHQDYPVGKLLHDLKNARSELSTLAYFSQAEFNYFQLPPPEPPAVWGGIPDLIQAGANALSMWVFPEPVRNKNEDCHGIKVYLKYDASLLEPAFVEQIANHYQTLIAKFISNPQTTLSALQASATFDKISLGSQLPTFPPVTESIVETAASHLNNPALACGVHSLTYNALLENATNVAIHLRQRGVGHNDVVGLICQRSVAAVVAMVGVVLAGGAYVVLDYTLPTTRLQNMLSEVQCKQIVVQRSVPPPAALSNLTNACLLEDLLAPFEGQVQPFTPSEPDDIAYAVFTSGSTGTPKAIAVPHSSLANLINWNIRQFSLGPDSVFLTPLQFYFDPHVMDIFASLAAGAKLVVTKDGGSTDPMYILEQIETHGVTHMNAVPSLLHMLLRAPLDSWKGRATSLRHILVGGEALPWSLVADAAEKLPACTIWNMYGPAEATVVSTSFPATPNLAKGLESGATWVPIGRPMQGVQTVVIGSQGFISPPGTVGELHIFGANLAKGYLRKGEIIQPFVPHPLLENCEMYRSGDLVRQRLDGVLEFVGRIDSQIKIRGHRVELGEINTVLIQHPNVAEGTANLAVVNDKPSLVAYVVLKSVSRGLKKYELEKMLQARLPPHMIPEFVVVLPSFLLTTNGKIDMKALPLPKEEDRLKETVAFTPPQTALEADLCEIFSQILKIKLGTSHNFFECGGTSMTAIACLQKIKQKCNVLVTVHEFYKHPTVSQLAALMKSSNSTTKTQEKRFIVKLHSSSIPDAPVLFMIHGAIRASSVFTHLQECLPADFPCDVYALTDPDGVFPMSTNTVAEPNNMNELIGPYLDEIFRVQPRGPYKFAGYCTGGIIAIAIAHRLLSLGHEISELILLDTTAPTFNNAQGLIDMDAAMIHALLAEELALQNGYTSTLDTAMLRELSIAQQRICLIDELMGHTVLERDLAGRIVDRCVTFFKTASKVLFSYDVPLPFPVPITLLSATEKWTYYDQYNPQGRIDCGWGDLLQNDYLRVIETPGNHLSMVRKPHAKHLVANLSKLLSSPRPPVPLLTPTPTATPVFPDSACSESSKPSIRSPSPLEEVSMDIITRAAIMAPSGHNTQPWRFFVDDDRIHLFVDKEYVEEFALCMDPDYSLAHSAVGCAAEAMHLVARAFGCALEEHFFNGNATLLKDTRKHNKIIPMSWDYLGFMQLKKVQEKHNEEDLERTWSLLEKRCSNRRKYQREVLEQSTLHKIEQEILEICPDNRGVGVVCVHGLRLQELAESVRQVESIMFSVKPLRVAALSSLGLDPQDHSKMFIGSLELTGVRVGALSKILSVQEDTFEFFQLHETLANTSFESFLHSSGAIVLLREKNQQSKQQDVELGKKLMHMWLFLTTLGFSVQCWTFPGIALSRFKPQMTQALTARMNAVVLPEEYKQTHTVALMLRFGHALPPSYRSGRISISDLSV